MTSDSDVASHDLPVSDEPSGHELGSVNADREADALCRENYGGVDSDDLPTRGDERTARVAGVQRGIGLDDVIDEAARARPKRAAERAHNARSYRRLKAVRVANGNDQLAHANGLRVPQRRRHNLWRIDSEHGKVGVRVPAYEVRLKPASIRQRHLDRCRSMHDVAVGKNKSVRCEDESRAIPPRLLRESRIHCLPAPAPMTDLDIHHRGAYFFGHPDYRSRIGVENTIIRIRVDLRGWRPHSLEAIA